MAEKVTKKKPNILKRIGAGIVRFVRDTRGEVKKIVWPGRRQVLNNFIVVAVFVVICAALIALLDWLFASQLMGMLYSLGAETISAASAASGA